MSFQCYWSTNPAYGWRTRTYDFVSAIIRSKYHTNQMFWGFQELFAEIADITSRTHWVSPPVHQINFQSFDLVKAIFKLDEALEEVEKELLNRPVLKYRIMARYSTSGYQNLNYGEVI